MDYRGILLILTILSIVDSTRGIEKLTKPIQTRAQNESKLNVRKFNEDNSKEAFYSFDPIITKPNISSNGRMSSTVLRSRPVTLKLASNTTEDGKYTESKYSKEEMFRKERCGAILSTMKRIMDNYHSRRSDERDAKVLDAKDKLASVKDKTYQIFDTSRFDEYTTTTTTTTTASPILATELFDIKGEEMVPVFQQQTAGILMPEVQTSKRSWESLNEFRKNPLLFAAYDQRPHLLMQVFEKVKAEDSPGDSIIDPLFVSKLILEKKLRVPSSNRSSLSVLLHDVESRQMFQKVFVEAPDLLKYITMAIAIKFPKQKFDFVNATLVCDFPREYRRPPSQLMDPMPWYLKLRNGIRVSFADRPYPWRHHLQKMTECIVENAARKDFSYRSRRDESNTKGVCYEYDKMLEYQKDFLNDIIEYPLALEIILKNEEFVNIVLEQAIKMEILSSLDEREIPIHEAIILSLLRNPKVLDVAVTRPGVVLSHFIAATANDDPHKGSQNKLTGEFIEKVKQGVDKYIGTKPTKIPDDDDEHYVKKIYIKDKPNINIKISK